MAADTIFSRSIRGIVKCLLRTGMRSGRSPALDQVSSGREVDRIDAMKVFIAALDEGGLRKAGRKLGRSPASISRALAFLEAHVGVTLLHRTTRSFKLSDAGERYAIVCRRVISDIEEADLVAAAVRAAPRRPPYTTARPPASRRRLWSSLLVLLCCPLIASFRIAFCG